MTTKRKLELVIKLYRAALRHGDCVQPGEYWHYKRLYEKYADKAQAEELVEQWGRDFLDSLSRPGWPYNQGWQ